VSSHFGIKVLVDKLHFMRKVLVEV